MAQEQTGTVANRHRNKEAQEQIDTQEQIGTRATRHRSKQAQEQVGTEANGHRSK